MGSNNFLELTESSGNSRKNARGGQGQLFFFKRASVKCPVVAQTQGYHLVCIWGSLVKSQGGGVVLKTMPCARVDLLSVCTGLTPVFQSSMPPSN